MAKSKMEIINDFEQLVARNGGKFAEWYVGMSANGKETLTTTHGFKPGKDTGSIRTALTEMQAQEVVDYMVRTRGCQGSARTFNANELHVYLYRRAKHTRP